MEPKDKETNERHTEVAVVSSNSNTQTTRPTPPKIYGDIQPSPSPQKPGEVSIAPSSIPQNSTQPEGVDIEKILLPTKEVHTSASAVRVSAGVLLAQEQTAELTPSPQALLPPIVGVEMPVQNQFAVQPIETFQGDVAKVIKETNTTVVSMAAAEANKRSRSMREGGEGVAVSAYATMQQLIVRTMLVVGGILLLAAAGGLIVYVYILLPSSVAVENSLHAPFIFIDDSIQVPHTANQYDRAELMSSLSNAKNAITLSLGLMARIEPTVVSTPDSETPQTMHAGEFLTLLSPTIPPELVRSIQPTFLLGVHSIDGNQPFLILKVDSYEQSFSGMLAWESVLRGDLAPLFTYTPRARIPEEGIAETTTPAQQFLTSEFVDKIVENHDARVVQNIAGDIFFLWTFLDRETIVITTNQYTLREILSRLKNAPTLTLP